MSLIRMVNFAQNPQVPNFKPQGFGDPQMEAIAKFSPNGRIEQIQVWEW